MKNITDFTIIQREKDGYGKGTFAGEFSGEGIVYARVVREDDNTVAVGWQLCDINGTDWSTEFVIPQGGLYRLEARVRYVGKFNPADDNLDWADPVGIAKHVGVGDIFVLAGQSNMAGYGRQPALDEPQLGVHLYDNAGEWVIASHPLNCVVNPIYPNNDSGSGISPGLRFGKIMSKRLGVPVGLVSACQGGSSLDRWNPAEEDPYLYRSMKDKIEAVGKFAGMAWYQGCNETNEDECYNYLEKFTEAVELWRKEFGDFPVVTCQLNRHASKTEDNELCWANVREAQRRAGLTIKDCFVIPTCDMPTDDGIHNSSSSCMVVGERMAYALLKGYYNQPGFDSPNIIRVQQISDNEIKLYFKDCHTFKTMDNNACGMNIEDEKGLMNCTCVTRSEYNLIVKGERKISGKAKFHAYWRKEQPAFFVRDIYGAPMLSCYNVEIEK